jgi:hypothetical protein
MGLTVLLTLSTNIVQIMKLNKKELTSLQIGRPRKWFF